MGFLFVVFENSAILQKGMSSPIIEISSSGRIIVYLSLDDLSGPATGLTYSDVTAAVRAESAAIGTAFTSKTLSALNFVEIGSGFYEIALSGSDTSTAGNMFLRISGSTINTVVYTYFVDDGSEEITPSPIVIGQTAVYGYVVDAQGVPVSRASVVFKTLVSPLVMASGSDGFIVTGDLITTKTDSEGFFTANLITGASVEVFISAANYRRVFVVPGSSSNLFELP